MLGDKNQRLALFIEWSKFLCVLVSASLVTTGIVAGARAQTKEQDTGEEDDENKERKKETPEEIESLKRELEGERKRRQELEDRLAALESKVGNLEDGGGLQDSGKGISGDFKQSEDEILADFQAEIEEEDFSHFLKIWGFFDLTFAKNFYEKGSVYSQFIRRNSSFYMTNLNLYIKSQMTETLSAIVEARLSFLPHGAETMAEIPGFTEYDRTNMQVMDPLTSQFFNQGGISIERAHLTYRPIQWFNVIAGRFLSPYGIWNVEHGSTVVIPAHIPYTQIRNMVPHAQTGLQLFGRVFLGMPTLFLDYAITLSNGPGPIEAVADLDENKAIGFKLEATYKPRKLRISAGAYAMFGKYTDSKKVAELSLNSDLTLNEAADMPVRIDVVPVRDVDQKIVATHVQVEGAGVTLQGEFIWTRWDFNVTEPRVLAETIFAGGGPLDVYYRASNIGMGGYVLLAYELPLAKYMGGLRPIPWIMFEKCSHDDTSIVGAMTAFEAGLNLKPSPYITLKFEGMLGIPESELYAGNFIGLYAQMAVSF